WLSSANAAGSYSGGSWKEKAFPRFKRSWGRPRSIRSTPGTYAAESSCYHSWADHGTERGSDRQTDWPFARSTRTFRKCSPGTRARLGALGVGRVRMLRAVGPICLSLLGGEVQAGKNNG